MRTRAPAPEVDVPWLVALLALLALASFGVVLAVLAYEFDALAFDRPLLDAVQSMGEWFEPLATYSNDIQHYWVIPALWVASIGLTLWLRRPGLAVLFLLAALAPLITEAWLKDAIGRPRPAGDFIILDSPGTLSFPSGHVMRATAFFGLWFVIAGEVFRPQLAFIVRVACVLLILLAAVSRVWEGVHWPSDTLGSITIGGAYIVLIVTAYLWARQRLRQRTAE